MIPERRMAPLRAKIAIAEPPPAFGSGLS